jgi:ABC-type multidrug transport system fused ATPase/permease subunit
LRFTLDHVITRSVSCMMQDPVLFSGTVRTNLDPFDEHNTATIWDALEKAQMKEAIESLPAGLDADVGDGGGIYFVDH